MVFGIGALSPGALKGLESLSLCTEGVFTQGKKRKVTPGHPAPASPCQSLSSFLHSLQLQWGSWAVRSVIKNGWFPTVNPSDPDILTTLLHDSERRFWHVCLKKFFPPCKLYPLNIIFTHTMEPNPLSKCKRK